jgi:sialidase-1
MNLAKFKSKLVSLIILPTVLSASIHAEIDEQILFKSGDEGYSNYRIPAIITAADGTLLAFCEARKDHRGDSGNIDLILKRSEDNGATWSSPQVIWDAGPDTAGNPCPVVDQRTGRIVMLMCWNLATDHGRDLHAGTGKDTRRVYQIHSDDHGKTWSSPEEITSNVKDPTWWWYATGPGIGIQLQEGPYTDRLVIPANHTTDGYYGAHTLYSDDGGESWNVSSTIQPTVNESQVVELSDGRLLMNMRSQGLDNTARPRNGYRSIAYSNDGGASWSDPIFDDELGDPRCQASLIRYDEKFLLFSNPNPPTQPERGPRIRMTVKLSEDDGQSWSAGFLVDEGPAAYSALVALPKRQVGLLYEKDKDIAFATFSMDLLH